MPVRAERVLGRDSRRRPPAFFAAIAIGAAGAMFVVQACSLDFTVRPDPGDAAQAAETGAEGSSSDASIDADAIATTDAPQPDATACAALANDLPPKRSKARECAFQAGECQAVVKDECNCDVVVSFAANTRTTDYESAVKAFLDAGCKPACNACKQNPNKNCLTGPSGTFCFEP